MKIRSRRVARPAVRQVSNKSKSHGEMGHWILVFFIATSLARDRNTSSMAKENLGNWYTCSSPEKEKNRNRGINGRGTICSGSFIARNNFTQKLTYFYFSLLFVAFHLSITETIFFRGWTSLNFLLVTYKSDRMVQLSMLNFQLIRIILPCVQFSTNEISILQSRFYLSYV